MLRRWELWLATAVGLVVAVVWYRHAHALGQMTGLSFGLADKLFDAELMFSGKYPREDRRTAVQGRPRTRRVRGHGGGPVDGLPGAPVVRAVLGVAGFAFYLLLVVGGNFQHDYYQLAIMPIAAIVIAPALYALTTASRQRTACIGSGHQVLALVLGLAAFTSFVRSASFHSWYDYGADSVLFCDSVNQFAEPGRPHCLRRQQRPGAALLHGSQGLAAHP